MAKKRETHRFKKGGKVMRASADSGGMVMPYPHRFEPITGRERGGKRKALEAVTAHPGIELLSLQQGETRKTDSWNQANKGKRTGRWANKHLTSSTSIQKGGTREIKTGKTKISLIASSRWGGKRGEFRRVGDKAHSMAENRREVVRRTVTSRGKETMPHVDEGDGSRGQRMIAKNPKSQGKAMD